MSDVALWMNAARTAKSTTKALENYRYVIRSYPGTAEAEEATQACQDLLDNPVEINEGFQNSENEKNVSTFKNKAIIREEEASNTFQLASVISSLITFLGIGIIAISGFLLFSVTSSSSPSAMLGVPFVLSGMFGGVMLTAFGQILGVLVSIATSSKSVVKLLKNDA